MAFNFSIPDLSYLPQLSPGFALNRYFRGGGPKNQIAYALVMNYIRLIDHAVREYQVARDILLKVEARESSLFIGTIHAACHYETALTSIRRALGHLKAIRSNRQVPISLKNLLPGTLVVLTGQVEGRIVDFRDAIQHLEERTERGEIVQGDPICVIPKERGIKLGSRYLSYTDLSQWLIELHENGRLLVTYHEDDL